MPSGIRVLCVDRPDSVARTKSILEDAGAGTTVESVSDPDVAFEALGDHIDCIVSAYEPPEIDGIELLRRVRLEHPELPFVLFAGDGTETIAANAVSAGVTDYFVGRPDAERAESIHERITSAVERYRDDRDREQELRRYRAIVEALDDAVYAVDGDGRIEYINEPYAEMKERPRDGLLGTPMHKWVDNDTTDRIYKQIAELEQGERDVVAIEYESLTVDGERIPAELRATDLEFPDGQRGRVGVIRDITERKERERGLERKNERLEEFASVVSHDLRNPLSTLSLALELIESDDDEHLERCRRSVDRMDQLIDELLSLARQGESVAETEPIALHEIAADCWLTVESTDADLRIDTDRRIVANEGRLKQLLENLFRNAVEHGTAEVTVTVGEMEGGFYVDDDGPGVPEDEREKVFENGYSTADDGTGFGLAIVSRVADAHGWTVRATESADGGARFEFTGVKNAR